MKYLLFILVLLALVIGLFQPTQASERSNTTWTVCASGCNFMTITSAVADAQVNPGDTLVPQQHDFEGLVFLKCVQS